MTYFFAQKFKKLLYNETVTNDKGYHCVTVFMPKYRKKGVLCMSVMRVATFIISVFIVGMVEMMVAGIMNLMSEDLGVSEAIIGQLVTLYALTFAICGPILVKLTNRFAVRPVLLWTLVAFIIEMQ